MNNINCIDLCLKVDKVTIIRRALLDDGREALIKEKINSANKENESCTIFDEISDDVSMLTTIQTYFYFNFRLLKKDFLSPMFCYIFNVCNQ